MKKMLFILNPCAGMRKANKVLPDIIATFNRADYDVSVYITAAPGEARQQTASRAAQLDLIVCCGGDGTFNETVSGILQSGVDVPVGYIPAGSTNDFAASLKLPTNPLQAAQFILEGTPTAYDIGRFGNRYFSYVASFGAFTRASYSTPQSVKNALGHVAYLLEGINELSQIRKFPIRMELNGEVVENDFLFGAISNSTSVGGILTLNTDQVDLGDGLFEILLIRAPKNLTELSECLLALQTQNYNNCAMITFCSTNRVTVYADPEMPWTLDGEREDGHAMVVAENLHHAIRLIQKV
jgi:YegS/Rv2252/BmrU family lipid kinase